MADVPAVPWATYAQPGSALLGVAAGFLNYRLSRGSPDHLDKAANAIKPAEALPKLEAALVRAGFYRGMRAQSSLGWRRPSFSACFG